MWTLVLILAALAGYFVVSLVAFIAFAADKFRAKAGAFRRTPEATLHLLSFLGGFPGSLLAMRVFRHKTSKPGFMTMTLLAAGLHAVLWVVIAIAAISLRAGYSRA